MQMAQNTPPTIRSIPLRTQLSPQTHRNENERSSMIIKHQMVSFNLPHAQRKLYLLVIVVVIDSTVDGQV